MGSGSVHDMSGRVVVAEVSEAPLSVDAALAAVSDPRVGGVGIFVGIVRDHHDGASVTGLDYSAHPQAIDVLRAVADEVAAAHDVVSIAVSHRVGDLTVGDLAVVVAVGAEHRAPALDACRELIESLKQQVPIWKHEHLTDGASVWVGS